MTFTEIVDRVAARLNLTGPVALARIGESVQERYQRLSASVGLSNHARIVVTGVATIGSPYMTFAGIERIDTLYDGTANPVRHLEEVTYDELTYTSYQTSSTPQRFAVWRIDADSITVQLDVNAATAFVLGAAGDSTVTTISGASIPSFPAKFHDILVYGAMAEELEHMEKYDMAMRQEQRWDEMLGQLRLYLASSAYLDIYQGKNSPTTFDGPPWMT